MSPLNASELVSVEDRSFTPLRIIVTVTSLVLGQEQRESQLCRETSRNEKW